MFELDPVENIPDAIARVLNEVFDDADRQLEAMGSPDPVEIERAVHQFRKRCKELRAVARLVRSALGPAYDRFNHLVRDASAEFSASRDAHVMLHTFDSLAARTDRSADVAAVRDRQRFVAQAATTALQRGGAPRDRARALLAAARVEALAWDIPDSTAPIANGLERTYRRGRRARRAAKRQPTDEGMHEWRKSAKNLWYAAQLLAPAHREALAALVNDLDALGELIGEDHDLAVFIERVELTELVTLARKRQRKLRKKALRLGKQIYREPPEEFADRIIAGWAHAGHARRPTIARRPDQRLDSR